MISRRFKRQILIVVLISFITFLVFLYLNEDFSTKVYYKTKIAKQAIRNSMAKPLKILVWGPPDVGNWIATRKEGMGDKNCPCNFTLDRTQVDDTDAVAFVAIVTDGNYSQLPLANQRQSKNPQLRIFLLLESPHRMYGTAFKNLPNNDQFNWTMTYRLDSDVPYLYYGHTSPKSKVSSIKVRTLSTHTWNWSMTKLESYKNTYLPLTKTKLVAWVVSNCKTVSKRNELVKEMSKHIQIDVYGECGDLEYPDNCKEFIGQNYKFYLAFENSLCHDYVTEKFFNALDHKVVPIVYGGANYTKLAPPGSYIDAMAFESVNKLVDRIKFLDQNPNEYLKYFLWREYYKTKGNNGWCELCWKMIKLSVIQNGKQIIDPNYSKTYKNISTWWYFKPKGDDDESYGEPACHLPPPHF